jgi:hypothetical protein
MNYYGEGESFALFGIRNGLFTGPSLDIARYLTNRLQPASAYVAHDSRNPLALHSLFDALVKLNPDVMDMFLSAEEAQAEYEDRLKNARTGSW